MSKMRSYHCAGSEHGVVKGTGEELVVGSVDGVAALEGNDVNTFREGGKVGAKAEWCRSVLEIERVQSVCGEGFNRVCMVHLITAVQCLYRARA
jgi:hypothetical protein